MCTSQPTRQGNKICGGGGGSGDDPVTLNRGLVHEDTLVDVNVR